jgi:hypothetical protein
MNINEKIKNRKFLYILIFNLLLSFFTNNPILNDNVKAGPILPHISRVLIWNFDDYNIQAENSSSIYRFKSMIENVTAHGGYIGISYTSTFSHISPQNITYTTSEKNNFNSLIGYNRSFAFYHGFNHSVVSGSYAEQKVFFNYCISDFYNNFGYNLNTWLSPGATGNNNTSVLCVEKNLIVIWAGSSWVDYDPDLKYLDIPGTSTTHVQLEKRIGFEWPNDLKFKSLKEMKSSFNKVYNNSLYVHISSHPYRVGSPFQGNETQNLKNFSDFVDWIYSEHNIKNMNYTDAYNYLQTLNSPPNKPSKPIDPTTRLIGIIWKILHKHYRP